MSKPFDATLKDLIESAPADWVAFLGQPGPAERVRVVDADLSTVTTAADKVIRVDDEQPWLLHIELQTGADKSLEYRLQKYYALLRERHELPVTTVVVLLRPGSGEKDLTGTFMQPSRIVPDWPFPYGVVRVWEEPAERFLGGGLGLLPLAPVAAVDRRDLPAVISRMRQRLDREANNPLAAKLWAASFVLLGLHYEEPIVRQLLQGVIAMRESSTYQAILREGREEGRAIEARTVLLLQGRKKFGPPSQAVESALNAISDVKQLEHLAERFVDVKSWEEWIPSA